MSKRFWSADIHANHGNVARYCNRPWLRATDLNADGTWVSNEAAVACAVRMNKGLIHEFNMRVKPEDTVIHVGDFATRGRAKGVEGLRESYRNFLSQLNGTWVLLRGNHDDQGKVKTIANHMICRISDYHVFVSHYPTDSLTHDPDLIAWVHDRCDFALCGHVHQTWSEKWVHVSHGKPTFLNINVGVDVRNYRPMSDDEVISLYLKHKKEQHETKQI